MLFCPSHSSQAEASRLRQSIASGEDLIDRKRPLLDDLQRDIAALSQDIDSRQVRVKYFLAESWLGNFPPVSNKITHFFFFLLLFFLLASLFPHAASANWAQSCRRNSMKMKR